MNPILPPVSSPVAFRVMPPMVRPSPGPRTIPSGAFAPCFRTSDSLMASSLPLKSDDLHHPRFPFPMPFLGGPTLILRHTATRRGASAEVLFTEIPRRVLLGNLASGIAHFSETQKAIRQEKGRGPIRGSGT